ncbi:Phage capsid scaffolding protein (GPO) serine peptidase [Achromobacter insolitus]|uniref:GPO family capsid scaffolding protein n=1 Tax=Achromobacter insolitus TaxID=217204 RepID=UPI0009729224|nr:GPO family capsid scaffolding protein [Achromobacter insolitus]APX77281.1 hypothetical protein BUW96_22225 [Achromobacter insolitus]OWT55005.1 phage capsid protein [Achromobacter insolitus]CAB3678359.1 hypothetical protein LMG6003_01465 [Achromobacter insolitus]VEG72323.1 Phage capsid scaffolding protein (GPO) serine peptidase [Achromobacter insolitus]
MKLKWFTVATEGQTTDKRAISRVWITQMAANYDPKKFGARIWVEHIRSLLPDSPFRAYGDVIALRTVENDEGKLQLQAQLDPTPSLVKMSKERQKIYSSIEVDEDFAGSGQAYLTGLAVTDNPASLGTEVLTFSATNPGAPNPFAYRKHRAENAFSSLVETPLDFTDEPPTTEETGNLLARVKDAFSRLSGKSDSQAARLEDVSQALEAFANGYTKEQSEMRRMLKELSASIDQFTKQHVTREDFDKLANKLDFTDADKSQRPPATGATGAAQLDC